MANKTNNKTNSSEKFSQLYDVFLYKKKDITAIQKKLSINSNVNQTAVYQSNKAKTLADSYELLLELEKFGIDANPILEVELRRDKASSNKPIRLFDLLLSLEDNIVVIQEKFSIIDYSNQERSEEVDENVKKIQFTGKGLPLFPNLTPQQLHKIFIKNLAGADHLSIATLLILQHPLRYFKLRHNLEISLIVISVIRQKLKSRCWSLGKEQITLQINISENSVRLEMFKYSNLWHKFVIADKPISFSDLNSPCKADILRYSKFEYNPAISFRALLV
ncbi:hypothetical protein C1645_819466 [Glomus cerebriforme]|uniref:Uncharacterized protein n=1 Tax=Glomus cerebriforme TaxID=658196 RepID=A0A397TAE7_9GLOM|nr:hypothetical protein C1645_819466 [Glomus cerebriforme]